MTRKQYFMMLKKKLFDSRICRILLYLNAALLFLFAVAIAATPLPSREFAFDGATIQIEADRAWVLLPRQCVNLLWKTAKTHSLRINGQEKTASGEMVFCPTFNATGLSFDLTTETGAKHTEDLVIQDLPATILTSAYLLTLLTPFLIALYYLATLRISQRIPLDASPALALLALLLVSLLVYSAHPFTLTGIVNSLVHLFISPTWQTFGLVLAGFVFIPLVYEYLQEAIRKRQIADSLIIVVFITIVLLLYLPFGFDSIGQKEEWINRAFLEGRASRMEREALMRFFAFYAYPLAEMLDSGSFLGLHLINFLIFCGKPTLLYCILRRLHVDKLPSFVTTAFFMIYPVNASLMSLRSFPLSLSSLTLLAAINIALDYIQKPSRLRLFRMWLALILTLFIHEIAFAIILVVPLLWSLSKPRKSWRNFNLTVIWYLVPVLKVVYLLILASAGLRFYGIQYVKGAVSVDGTILDTALHYANVIADVYRQTFWHGWSEAFSVMGANKYFLHILISVSLIAVVMALLAIDKRANALPSRKEAVNWLLGGLLLILPAIGIGMWIDKYLNEMWRLYVLVPFGASIALCGVLLLVTAPIKKPLLRKAALVIMSLLLVLPGLARLYVQHAHFVESANAKAKILLRIVEQAPRYDSNARLALVTDMSLAELSELGIDELWTHMFDSSIYLLYGDDRPKFSSLCILGEACSTNDIDKTLRHLDENTNYSEIVIFQLQDDLSVELLRELPPELGGASNATYNPARLIDASAPLPPRALTMLAAARRD